tara:strand:- start:2255 stop:3043 length:789 start_codon:yes stop_codon:yes gene_type:complete
MADDIDDIMVPRLDEVAGGERLIPTLTEDGMKEFPASDIAAWLSENQHERPPGSGPDGKWTLADEEEAGHHFRLMGARAQAEGEELTFGDRPPYDAIADSLINEGFDYSPEGARERALRDIGRMTGKVFSDPDAYNLDDLQAKLAQVKVEMAGEGLDIMKGKRAEFLDVIRDGQPLPMPDTEAVARKVLPVPEKPPKRPDEYSLEQYDRGAIDEEQGRKTGMKLMREGKEAFDQYEYNKDQEDLKTPGYNKRGVDNPHGKLE